MKLAIMQPYLLPYLGYFQLVAQVDSFVFYDDVNFIKNGWINRNRLLAGGEARYFTIPLQGASSFARIADVGVQPAAAWRRKMLNTVRQSYSRAPSFDAVFALLEDVLEPSCERIAELAKRSVAAVAGYLGLGTQFEWTSAVYGNEALGGAARVLDICRRAGAAHYYNLPGGRELYDADEFAAAGVTLHFIEPHLPPYAQGRHEFVPGLSILDVLMWNEREAAARMVQALPAAAGP